MISYLLLLILTNAEAISLLPPDERYGQPKREVVEVERVIHQRSAPNRDRARRRHTGRSNNRGLDNNLNEDYKTDAYYLMEHLNNANEKIRKLTERRGLRPHVIEKGLHIMPLDEFKGIILNSALVSNHQSEITVVSLERDGPLQNAKLDCRGSVLRQRIKAYCSRIIWPDRVEDVRVLLRDGVDGVDAIKADEFWTGEEAEFLKASFATLAGGFFDSAKNRSRNDFGDVENAEAKNRLLEGLISVADDNTQKALGRTRQQQIVAVLEAGTKVTIQFLERVQ